MKNDLKKMIFKECAINKLQMYSLYDDTFNTLSVRAVVETPTSNSQCESGWIIATKNCIGTLCSELCCCFTSIQSYFRFNTHCILLYNK